MTAPTVIEQDAPVNDGAEKTPVFNSLEELEKYEASRQPEVKEEIKEPVKSEEVAKTEPIIDKAEQPQFDVVSFLKGSFGEAVRSQLDAAAGARISFYRAGSS